MGISSVGSFPVHSGGSLNILQLFGCRNLALNRVFSTLEAGMGGFQFRGHPYATHICLYTPYICMPPVHLYAPYTPCKSMFSLYHMLPICNGDLGASVHPMYLGVLWGHQYICQVFQCLSVHSFASQFITVMPIIGGCFFTRLDAYGCVM